MNSRELYNRLVDVYLINKEIVEGRFFSSKGQTITIRNRKKMIVIPIASILKIEYSYRVEAKEEIIKLENLEIHLLENEDIFDDVGMAPDVRRRLQTKVMYIDDKLFMRPAEAREMLKNTGWQVKVNGRLIKSKEDLTPFEKAFIGEI